jgi:D-alanyl-D-alanine carboxypeptidase
MRKLGLSCVAPALASLLTPSFAYASCAVPNVVRAGAVADATTGEILSSHGNIDTRFNPASITKILTTLVILGAIRNGQMSPTQQITVVLSQDGYNGDRLSAGTMIALENALRASSASQNGIYIAIARAYPGGMNAFVQRMNEIARIAGAENTNFINPNGLFQLGISQNCAQQYTTIRDQFRILHYAQREYPQEIRQYFGQSRITYNNTDPNILLLPTLNPTSALLADRDQIAVRDGIDIDFVKTGFIRYSGAHIFASATIQGHRVYGIETGMQRGRSTENQWYRIRDMALLNAFRNVRNEFTIAMATNDQRPFMPPYIPSVHVNFSNIDQPLRGQPQSASLPRLPRDNFLPPSLRPVLQPTQQIADSSLVTLSM